MTFTHKLDEETKKFPEKLIQTIKEIKIQVSISIEKDNNK